MLDLVRVNISMVPSPFHLGTVSACNTDTGISLDLATSIELSPSEFLDQSVTGLRPIEMLTSREVWVTRAPGCRLAIQLLVDGERPRNETWRLDTAEFLGRILRDAEVLANALHLMSLD